MTLSKNHVAVFMTATDTGVGKTTMTAALALSLQQQGYGVGVLKPVETGIHPQQRLLSDTERLRKIISPTPPFDSVCLYAFAPPLAPLACARESGITIDVSRLKSFVLRRVQQHVFCLVEGAGGIFTPLTSKHTMRDVMSGLQLPVFIVGRTSLGGVNHMRLTGEALERAGITVWGIILNDADLRTPHGSTSEQRHSTIELIREWSSVPVFGPIEYQDTLGGDWERGVDRLATHPEIQRVSEFLIARLT